MAEIIYFGTKGCSGHCPIRPAFKTNLKHKG